MDLEKLAELFEQEVSNKDILGRISYVEEAGHLKLLAGKIRYKANKEQNRSKSVRLKEVAEMLLSCSDILRGI